jgi:hypothetical protein
MTLPTNLATGTFSAASAALVAAFAFGWPWAVCTPLLAVPTPTALKAIGDRFDGFAPREPLP